MTNLDSRDIFLIRRGITLSTKVHLVNAMVFSVVIYACESWAAKKTECWRIDASELWSWRRLESPSDCKEIQSVHPKGDHSCVIIGRTDVETEIPMLWPPDGKSWLIGKDLDAGKDWGHEEKGTTEDEMIGWHHRLNGHGFEQSLAVGDGQGGLVYLGLWVAKSRTWLSDWPELNWTEIEPIQNLLRESHGLETWVRLPSVFFYGIWNHFICLYDTLN